MKKELIKGLTRNISNEISVLIDCCIGLLPIILYAGLLAAAIFLFAKGKKLDAIYFLLMAVNFQTTSFKK